MNTRLLFPAFGVTAFFLSGCVPVHHYPYDDGYRGDHYRGHPHYHGNPPRAYPAPVYHYDKGKPYKSKAHKHKKHKRHQKGHEHHDHD